MADRRFVVKENIPVGGVWAYTRGQVIDDAEAIERNGWQDYVVGEGSKEGRQIHAEITGQSVDEPEQTSRAAAKTSEQKG